MDLIQTNWVVVTGGPSAGKTSLCRYLAYLGHIQVPESSCLLMDIEISKGHSVSEIRANNEQFQRQVLHLKSAVESRSDPTKTIVLDRGIPDSWAYGTPETEVRAHHFFRYRKVFFLEPVEYQRDYFRTESEAEAIRLSDRVFEAYTRFGYEIIRVSKGPIPERAESLLSEMRAWA